MVFNLGGEPKQHDVNAPGDSTYQLVSSIDHVSTTTESRKGEDLQRRSSARMQGYRTQISWAVFLMFIPLILMAVLLALIYSNNQTRNTDTDTPDHVLNDGKESPTDENYLYVHYSATRLAFVSSLAATLSLALVPVALPMLFAYVSASTLLRISRLSQDKLPSPYQVELLIRMLDGGTLEIFHYLKYVFKKKRQRISTVPVLNHAALMLSVMLMLAIGITVVDALFHLRTISVQYKRTSPDASSNFLPSRQLPTACWNVTEGSRFGCNYVQGGSGAAQTFTNSTEGFLAVGNQSTKHTVQLTDDGRTAVIVPPQPPSGTSYNATSFASSTECQTVTRRCRPHSNRVSSANAGRSWAFDCIPEDAGLLWNGNFTQMSSLQAVTLNYFNTSDMTMNQSTSYARNGNLWFAALFYNPRDDSIYETGETETIDDGLYYYAEKDLVMISDGPTYGLLSCKITLSDVEYTHRMNGAISNAIMRPMNETTSAAFLSPLVMVGAGQESFNSGIRLVNANSKNKEDLAYQFARLFDRTILSLASGVLLEERPLSISVEQTSQVAQVPIAELVALVALNLLYPIIGVILGVWALVLCRRDGVRDVQARLGIGAMVAGNFEDKQFNATATSKGELYAELRGLPTKRVAVTEGPGGSKVLAVT